jgi:hypothetical protein
VTPWRRSRADQVGLAGGRAGPVEQIDQLAGRHPLTTDSGLAVDVERQARGGVGQHADGRPHVGDGQRGGRVTVEYVYAPINGSSFSGRGSDRASLGVWVLRSSRRSCPRRYERRPMLGVPLSVFVSAALAG